MISFMADLLLRNVPTGTLDALKERARVQKRSVQAEALAALERGVETTVGASLVAWAKTVRTDGVDFAPAVGFVREMRDER